MRPLKLRLALLIVTSLAAGTPMWLPMHGPQPGVPIMAPAARKVWM